MEFNTFINKEMFGNLAYCVALVEACTESTKMLIGDMFNTHYIGLWIAFIFSILISFIRFTFEGETTKEGIILAIINTVPIFLGAVGAYQVGIKPLTKLLQIN